MEAEAWISRCAEHLQQQWPQVGPEDLSHLAHALWADRQWQGMDPHAAAERWMQALEGRGPQGCGGSTATNGRDEAFPLHTRARSGPLPARRETGECR